MSTKAVLKNVLMLTAVICVVVPTLAQQKSYAKWLGKEPKEMDVLLEQFIPLCESIYPKHLPKLNLPYKNAAAWAHAHCHCVSERMKSTKIIPLIQVVNMDLRGQIGKIPDFPDDLKMYLDGYENLRGECLKPKGYSEKQTNIDEGIPKHGRPQMRGSDKDQPHLPVRPQKSGAKAPGVE